MTKQYTLKELSTQFTHFTTANEEGWSKLFNIVEDDVTGLVTSVDDETIFLPFGAREELIKLGLEEVQA